MTMNTKVWKNNGPMKKVTMKTRTLMMNLMKTLMMTMKALHSYKKM